MQFKITPIILLAMLNCIELTAQRDIDSLQAIFNNYKPEDTIKVNLLNQMGFEYWIINPEKSDELGNMALELAQKLNFEKGEAFAHRVIGVANWARGNYEIGLIELLKALTLYDSMNDALGEANCNLNIGLIYADQRNFDLALSYYMSAIERYENLQRTDRIATTYNKVGEVYIYQKKFNEAYEYLIKALDIHQNNGFQYGIAESNNRLGLLFNDQGKHDEGLKYLFSSLEISKKIDDREGIARDYENIGNAYLQKKDYANAEIYLTKAEEKARSFGSKKWLRNIYADFKTLTVARSEWTKALYYSDLYMAMKDSLFNEQMANRIAELEKRKEVEVRERELELVRQERQLLEEKDRLNSRLKMLLSIALLLLLLSAYLIINRQRLRIKKDKDIFESKEALARVQLTNAQLKESELKQELEFKNKELTSYTINFIRKNEVMEELKESIKEAQKGVEGELSKKLSKLNRIVDNALDVDKDWEDFKLYFENVHKDFFSVLKQRFPELGNSELKLCALIKLNLNMKESAAIMGISPESVKTARYRLRKKLNLNKDESLADFLMAL